MNEQEPHAVDETPERERPERWDQAVMASYIYDLLRGSAAGAR
ncbi:MAG TPA: hypothetical protein VFY47_02040 [Thermoleophilaceae bacterium]|jgi:hypothetical protein|nr:hypothetical protein [Thermoleophilaceae bacterium]